MALMALMAMNHRLKRNASKGLLVVITTGARVKVSLLAEGIQKAYVLMQPDRQVPRQRHHKRPAA